MINYKLGKAPAIYDNRTLGLRTILRVLPALPISYDYDLACGTTIPTPMFANDLWGDCVIAGRAHMTLRFEKFEQDKILSISNEDVLREYWLEQGATETKKRRWCKTLTTWSNKPDNGLVMLDSLKAWRNKGWQAAGQHYDIYAFAGIYPKDHDDVRASIFLLGGTYIGLALPKSAQNQEIWDISTREDAAKNSWGGHCVSISQYDNEGLICVTWSRKQKMTWKFLDTYCDECYGIVDNKNRFISNSPVDIDKLADYLRQITK